MIILTPTTYEFQIARERFKESDQEIILAGVGPRNMKRLLSQLEIPRNTPIMIFGFAGSNSLKVGTEVYVTESYLYFETATYGDDPASLSRPNLPGAPELGVPCYSSTDFVTRSNLIQPAIFDMELGFLTVDFPQITAWRIVSDNLSLNEFNDFVGRGRKS